MQDLFSTNISVDNQSIVYRVLFDKDQYMFVSEADNVSFPSFSFRREHDSWVDQDLLPPAVKQQAEDALENYLLKQL